MSLYTLPVTGSDLTSLQEGLTFSNNPGTASTQADAINKTGGPTVFSYAQELLGPRTASSTTLSPQVAMADFAYALGKTDTVSHLDGIVTNFMPAQVQFAVTNNLLGGPTVYAAQVYALALATSFSDFRTSLDTQFNNKTFVSTTATLTGTNDTAIQNFFNVWLAFYTANPIAAPGLTAQQAALASAWGDAMGVALTRDSNDTGPGIAAARAIQDAVVNALYDNAQTSSSPPGVKYVEGVPIANLLAHTKFQGEGGGGGGGQTFTFTPQTDNFTGTGGNDTFQGTISANGTAVGDGKSTLSPQQFDKATDSGGNDTINLAVAAGGASLNAVATLVTGVETWSIDETAGAITDAGGLSVKQLQGATFIEQRMTTNTAGNFKDFTKVGSGQAVGFSSTQGTDVAGKNITVDTGNNTATVKLGDVGNVALNFKETNASDLTKAEVSGKMGAVANATLAVTTTATGVQTDVFSLDKTTTTTKTTITIAPGAANALDALKTIDAGGSAASLVLDISGANFKNVTTVKTGSGDDTFTDAMANRTATATPINEDLGSGKDTANLKIDPATPLALNINLGTGADAVVVTGGKFSNIKAAPSGNLETQLVTIDGLVVADSDTINITGGAVPYNQVAAGVQGNINNAATLTAATTLAAATLAAANTGTWFEYKNAAGTGVDAYIFDQSNAGATFDAGDGLIKIVGVTSNQLLNPAFFIHT